MTAAVAIAVVLSGALGAVVRYLVSRAFAAQKNFPWAVLVVNLAGAAIGGAVLALTADADLRLILLTGICGGLTTFSTLSVETIQLAQDGKARLALLSVLANVVLGVAAAAGAFALFS